MAEISTTVANNKLRSAITDDALEWAKTFFDCDCLRVGNNEISMPFLNEKGDEIYVNISVTIPKGERDTANHRYLPYDGYAAAEAYNAEVAKKEDAVKAKAEAAALKKKRDRKPKKEPAAE